MNLRKNGQIQESVFGGDNGSDTDFAMDKNKGSEPTENGQIQESVFGGDNDQILTLPWIQTREVDLRKIDRYGKVFLVDMVIMVQT